MYVRRWGIYVRCYMGPKSESFHLCLTGCRMVKGERKRWKGSGGKQKYREKGVAPVFLQVRLEHLDFFLSIIKFSHLSPTNNIIKLLVTHRHQTQPKSWKMMSGTMYVPCHISYIHVGPYSNSYVVVVKQKTTSGIWYIYISAAVSAFWSCTIQYICTYSWRGGG